MRRNGESHGSLLSSKIESYFVDLMVTFFIRGTFIISCYINNEKVTLWKL
jgi:hypothetical protein